ncbi:MAG: hypothetical protein HZB21_05790 [Deltaproteobacteria bacterium]|nr:hypothetical protein [Deltaproteobacteria bacterium]
MSYQHKELAAGRWQQLPLVEQMANIGGEVERALNWRAKGNAAYCQQAAERALELMDLTLDSVKVFSKLKEIARVREVLVDYFFGENEYGFTEAALRRYFFNFTCAARWHL